MSTASLFRWRHFLPEIILLNVRWYYRYPLSYRDLEELRWIIRRSIALVLKYTPELDKRIRPHLRTTNDSWQVDETDIAR